ncbi:cyclic nucleotide-binding domain-containing protein [Patescibacteria group bacterium]|nr:cyclic nucleotide-binding domain-containing protein [Patescibacteria group bacterium]
MLNFPYVQVQIKNHDYKSMNENAASIVPILKQLPFFANLNEQDHLEIIKNIQMQLFPVNYPIFKEGEPGDKMYIIRKGQVKVNKGGEDIAMLNTNDFFGEMALFSSEPRNATCITTLETEVFTLSKDDMFKLIQTNPELASHINAEFLDRIKENDARDQQKNQ